MTRLTKKLDQDEELLFMILLDFLREIPKNFDVSITTMGNAEEMILKFMESRGLIES